jgi:tetratricopeptide (TPR) repeat protein
MMDRSTAMTHPPPDVRSPAGPPFAGHLVVFSGRLASVGRREAIRLVEELGGRIAQEVTARTTMLVVGAEATAGKSGKLRKAEEINVRTPRQVNIVGEQEFCRLGGLQSDESLRQLYHGLRQICERYPGVREVRLRHLEKWGLIRPVVRTNADTYFGFHDVGVVKRIQQELERGGSFRGAVRLLLAEREGQLALDFDAVRGEAHPAKVIALSRRSDASSRRPPDRSSDGSDRLALAARFFLEGSELDEQPGEGQERARVAYQKALLLDPALVPALVNLANIHYARDNLVEAQALYERALALDGDCFEAAFNLGNIHHDLGRYDDAVACYHDALRVHGGYADAHFYLAVTLEKMGRSAAAKPHWRTYRTLAPDGEWSDLAREFSE